MTLLRPAALVVLVLGVPILALYVLRLKRPERLVGSTLLWRGIVEDMRANAPWQRLRLSTLLAVQLITVAALALTLAQPAFSRTQEFSGDVVLILDQSYSMQATDARPTRFAAAQARAQSIASQITATNAVSVIGMGNQPVLGVAQSTDAGAVNTAIQRLYPGASRVNVPAALSLAASLARPGRRTQAVILTDRSSGLSPSSLHLPFPVTVIRFGSLRRDLGIVGFAGSGGTYTHALARIHNFGDQTASGDFELWGGGQLLDVRPTTVGPGATATLAWDHLPAGLTSLRARLDRRDDMPNDKTAWAVVPLPTQRHVVLVTQSDYYLETALALDPSVVLQVLSPAGFSVAGTSHADAIIFDGVLPPAHLTTSTLVVNPPAGTAPGVSIGALSPGGTLAIAAGAPGALSRYIRVGDVQIAQVRALHHAPGLAPVLRIGSTPVMVAGQSGSFREAVLGFSLADTDWPLRVSFPLFIHDVVNYLAPGVSAGAVSVQPGDAVPLSASGGARGLKVTRPDGVQDSLAPPFPPFTDTSLPGIYTVTTRSAGGAPVQFAVNSFPPMRSDSPAPSSSRSGGTGGAAVNRVEVPVDMSWVAGLLVLVLLGAEWWIGMRG